MHVTHNNIISSWLSVIEKSFNSTCSNSSSYDKIHICLSRWTTVRFTSLTGGITLDIQLKQILYMRWVIYVRNIDKLQTGMNGIVHMTSN